MPTTTKEAALEAAYLVQAFVAAIECLQITALAWPVFGLYSFITHLIGPILAFALLFTIFLQIKLSSPNRKQTLRLELVKSAIVSVLWVWLLVSSIVAPEYGYPWPRRGDDGWYRLVNVITSLLFITIVFYSTLWFALRKERNPSAAAANLLG